MAVMAKAWQEKNKEKIKEKRKEKYYRTREDNIAKVIKWQKENKQKANKNKLKYVATHPDRVKVSKRKWVKNNYGKVMAIKSKRRSRELNAYPSWITAAQKKLIVDIYNEAKRISKETGTPHVVDHIWPLAGKTASGLHVPWNLRVITHHENSVKNNKPPKKEDIPCII
jgi:hypothetical protein